MDWRDEAQFAGNIQTLKWGGEPAFPMAFEETGLKTYLILEF